MKRTIVICVLFLFLVSCVGVDNEAAFIKRKTKTPTPTLTSTSTPTSTNTPLPTSTNTPVPTSTNTPVPTATEPNIFGAMMPMDAQGRQAARALGINYYRNISAVFSDEPLSCPSCEAAVADGYRLILTVRGNKTASPLTDINAYIEFVRNMIRSYRPEIVVVENEESTNAFFSGSANQYLVELNAACEVAHAEGIKCTNGGLASKSILLMLWQYTYGGFPNLEACNFAQRAFNITESNTLCSGNTSQTILNYITRTKSFYDLYGGSPIDFINMHYYMETTSTGNNISALADAVAFMGATGKSPIINEWGLRVDDTTALGVVMHQMRTLVPIAIYFSPSPAAGQDVIELQDDTGNLSNLGIAFSESIYK